MRRATLSVAATVTAYILTASSANAAAILTFNLTGSNPAIDGVVSGALSQGGVTATLTANTGTLNSNASTFGVNAPGNGDTADQMDDGSGTAETVTITFNHVIVFNSIDVSSFGVDSGSLNVAGTIFNFSSTGTINTGGIAVHDGQNVIVSYVTGTGDGFSFDEFEVIAPEPTSAALLLMGSVAIMARRRRAA